MRRCSEVGHALACQSPCKISYPESEPRLASQSQLALGSGMWNLTVTVRSTLAANAPLGRISRKDPDPACGPTCACNSASASSHSDPLIPSRYVHVVDVTYYTYQ